MIPAIMAGAAIGGALLNKPKDSMSPYLKAALAQIEKVQVPDVESLKVKLQQLVQQGVMSPEQAEASLVEYNAFDNTSPNAQARGAQMSALQGLQDQVSAGGLTDVARSRIQSTLDEVNNNERGQQEAIMDNAHKRGVSGSGLELANRLMSQQSAASNAGRQGIDIAAMAEQAKMDALKSAAQLGGQIETNDFSQQAQKAQAQNTINQFNATNQQQVTMANIAAQNAAQMANLKEKQRVSDENTAMENTNRLRNSDLIQTNFENKMDKAKAVAGGLGSLGRAAQTASNTKTAATGELIGGLSDAGTTYFSEQEKARKEAKSTAPQSFYMAKGGEVPGEALYPGDDIRNDQVPAMLSPGEVVIPRSETSDYDKFMGEMPRSENKPTPDAVRLVLEALSGMGC